MKNMQDELKDILSKIELTQEQRERAKNLYISICGMISESLDIDFYPQGSFATKTVVRPWKNGQNQSYDVDVICEYRDNDVVDLSPSELKARFRTVLDESRYSNHYKEWDKCFTIEYAEGTDGEDFSIDIIPAIRTHETNIKIPDTLTDTWISNNPKGYQKWFELQILNFANEYRTRHIKQSSIAPLPEPDIKNSLLQAIKLLKRHRDFSFSRRKSENRPASIVITTAVGYLSNSLPCSLNIDDILRLISEHIRTFLGSSKNVEEWYLPNPANSNDNILSSWNKDNERAKEFFAWLDEFDKFIECLPNLSRDEISKQFGQSASQTRISFSQTAHSKPWRAL